MSNRQLRIQQRYDYSDSGTRLGEGPLNAYSQAREPLRYSGESSSDENYSTPSESDASTIVQHESDLESLSDLTEEFRGLTMEQDAASKKLFASQESLREDIEDFIEEN